MRAIRSKQLRAARSCEIGAIYTGGMGCGPRALGAVRSSPIRVSEKHDRTGYQPASSRDGEMGTQIDRATIVLKRNGVQAITVALHELATNAAKHGALSVAKGHLRIERSRAADGGLVLR